MAVETLLLVKTDKILHKNSKNVVSRLTSLYVLEPLQTLARKTSKLSTKIYVSIGIVSYYKIVDLNEISVE